ncbi:MAG: DUF1641 domain-containing protein [Fervidicoccaceae archaeon]
MESDSNEIEIQAIKDLLEIAVELKKSGILGMLKEMLSDSQKALSGMQADTSLLRLGVLLGAMLEASRRLNSEKIADLKENTEDTALCLLSTVSSSSPQKAPRLGILGLLKEMRDPKVQKGLGYLVELLKNMGSCLGELEAEKIKRKS